MDHDIEMLNSIRKATQMGCYGIETVLKEEPGHRLEQELRSQLAEYEKINEEATRLLNDRGGELKNVNPMARYGSDMGAKMKIRIAKDPQAKIAALMVQGNTRGMIKSIHNIRSMGVLDPKVSTLSNRLLQTEQSNIDMLKQYL